jgi:rubrerythrin
METTGSFSLYKKKEPQPGLSVLPKEDKAIQSVQQTTDKLACNECGFVSPVRKQESCPACHSNNWVAAVI